MAVEKESIKVVSIPLLVAPELEERRREAGHGFDQRNTAPRYEYLGSLNPLEAGHGFDSIDTLAFGMEILSSQSP